MTPTTITRNVTTIPKVKRLSPWKVYAAVAFVVVCVGVPRFWEPAARQQTDYIEHIGDATQMIPPPVIRDSRTTQLTEAQVRKIAREEFQKSWAAKWKSVGTLPPVGGGE